MLNKKKIATLGMAALMIAPTAAIAENVPAETGDREVTEAGKAKIEFYATQAESYTVTLPKSLDVSNVDGDSNNAHQFLVKVKGNINGDHSVYVALPDDDLLEEVNSATDRTKLGSRTVDIVLADDTSVTGITDGSNNDDTSDKAMGAIKNIEYTSAQISKTGTGGAVSEAEQARGVKVTHADTPAGTWSTLDGYQVTISMGTSGQDKDVNK